MMQAPGIVLEKLNQLPTLETVTIHAPGTNEVSVRMKASGICHTDISYMRDARACPVLLGHEGAGVVEQVGENVTHVKPGDHVVINWQVKCGKCKRCLAGRQDLCENIQGVQAPRIFWKDQPLNIMLNAGTFCPIAIVPAMGAVPIRKDMPFEKAALLGCAVATGVGAALYTAEIQPGEGAAVIGAGGVGLNVIQGARLANADPIIAIDIDDAKLEMAKRYGATHTINSNAQDPVKTVKDLTGGRGVEYAFEVVGVPQLMLQAIDMLARGGALVFIGAAARDATLPFFPRRFMSQQQRMLGCIYGNIRPGLDFPLFANWYMDGRLLLDELHTRSITLDDVPDAFAHHTETGGVRTVVSFD